MRTTKIKTMKITNKYKVPEVILRAARNDTYSRGDSIKSVTQLIGSPRIDILRRINHHQMEEDITRRMWALLGRGVHNVLEHGAKGWKDYNVEERLSAVVNGWKVSGAIDVQKFDDGTYGLIDWKMTAAYSVTSEPGGKKDWINQQNFYAWLMHETKGIRVAKIEICVIVRDWREKEAQANTEYPEAPIVMIELPLWSLEEQEAYVKKRVGLHQNSEVAYMLRKGLPLCTHEEQWGQGDKWAVLKHENAKRATRVFDTKEAADDFIYGNTEKFDSHLVERRAGKAVRCEGNYCGVNEWCNQYKGTVRK
jgi:hypothetical protein